MSIPLKDYDEMEYQRRRLREKWDKKDIEKDSKTSVDLEKYKETLRRMLEPSINDTVQRLGLSNTALKKNLLDSAVHNILKSLQSIKTPCEISFLDINGVAHKTTTDKHRVLLLEAVIEKYKTSLNGVNLPLNKVLLHSDKRCLMFEDDIHIVGDLEVAQYINEYCLTPLMIDIIYYGSPFNKLISGDTINILKQYVRKAGRIYNSKFLMFGGQLPNETLDDEYFELKYIVKQLDRPRFSQLYNLSKIYQQVDDIDIDKIAKDNNIFTVDLLFRLYNKMKLEDAIQEGINDRVNYGLQYHGALSEKILYNIPLNYSEILTRVIKSEINNE